MLSFFRLLCICALFIQPVNINPNIEHKTRFEWDDDWLSTAFRTIELNQMKRTKDVAKLHPEMQKRVKRFLYLLQRENIRIVIVETYRHPKVQEALYAQGRNPLSKVNFIRKAAGLLPFKHPNQNVIITYARGEEAKHLQGLAIDIMPYKNDDKWAVLWEKVGRCGELSGLVWGGRWKQRDLTHFEFKGIIPQKQK